MGNSQARVNQGSHSVSLEGVTIRLQEYNQPITVDLTTEIGPSKN